MSDQELNNKTPELLYHYCSVETFFQIIKNQTLRLTNIQYMNDSEELHYGLDQIEKLDTNASKSKKEHRDYISIYAMCFSEEGDLLSQWRGYGDNAEGVSIGFDFSILKDEKVLQEEDIHRSKISSLEYFHSLQKVIYNLKDQEKKINEFIKCRKTFSDQINRVAMKIWSKLISSLKNPNFNEEKEWRFISGVSQRSEFDKSGKLNNKDTSLSFCVTNKNIVPYIDRDFEDIFNMSKEGYIPRASGTKFPTDADFDIHLKHLCPIKKIIIGSSCKLDEITIKKFLFHHKMFFGDLKIEKSKLSYKAK